MVKTISKISENTLVPISLVIVLGGGIAWLTSMSSDARATKDDISDLKTRNESRDRVLRRIDQRLSRIEGKLGVDGPLRDE